MPVALLAALLAATDAPITQVTVYSDRARVTRSAALQLNGSQKLELPLLSELVDPNSIRVEASGGDVVRVDVERLDDDELPLDEARKLLAEIEKADDAYARAAKEAETYRAQAQAMEKLAPSSPSQGAMQPPTRLNGSGWAAAAAFAADAETKLQAKSREADERAKELDRQRNELRQKAALLGGARRRQGYRVTPTVSAQGPVKLAITYLTARARWYPVYDLQLSPASGKVQVSFAGEVSQETGEDWNDAQLVLSTAVPATATQMPKFLSWKIGEKDRFIPQPAPMQEYAQPLPIAPLIPPEREETVLRSRLLAYAGVSPNTQVGPDANETRLQNAAQNFVQRGDYASAKRTFQQLSQYVENRRQAELQRQGAESAATQELERRAQAYRGALSRTQTDALETRELERLAEAGKDKEEDEKNAPAARPTPPAAPMEQPAAAEDIVVSAEAAPTRSFSFSGLLSSGSSAGEAPPSLDVSLSPPPAWQRPTFDPELPVSLAGGYDLTFASLRAETVKSGKGARRVALFSESWPVQVERKLFPALAPEAFLVAEIKSPSSRVLPGGNAALFVGDDPAGSARLKLVSPGEPFTLPLGLDRAVKPTRNTQLVQAEKGLISKDDVGEYVTTIEIPNPYDKPIATRIHDQWPISSEKDVEVKLTNTTPWAISDPVKGTLEWHITVPPHGKSTVSFTYTVRRPKGWKLRQWQ